MFSNRSFIHEIQSVAKRSSREQRLQLGANCWVFDLARDIDGAIALVVWDAGAGAFIDQKLESRSVFARFIIQQVLMQRGLPKDVPWIKRMTKANQPPNRVWRLEDAGIVKRGVAIFVHSLEIEMAFFNQIGDDEGTIVLGRLLEKRDPIFILEGEIGMESLGKVNEQIFVGANREVQRCPAVVKQGLQVDPIAHQLLYLL